MIATLSPRGFETILARNGHEVLTQVHDHPNDLRFAVVDASIPDYPLIAGTLAKSEPNARILVLRSTGRPEDITPLLLDAFPSSARAKPKGQTVEPARFESSATPGFLAGGGAIGPISSLASLDR